MKCYCCGKVFFERRTFKTLFKENLLFRCKSCEVRYPAYETLQVIPKSEGLIYLSSLFKEENNFDIMAYNQETSKWFMNTLNNMNKNDIILWIDELSEEMILHLDLLEFDIYLLTKSINYFS